MIGRDEAYALVCEHIPAENLQVHCVATEVVMEALARHKGLSEGDVARWAIAGLLHDLDYATTAENPARHGLDTAEMLAGRDVDDELLHAILGHCGHVPLQTDMDRALYAVDPTTGFIVAAALVRPERDIAGVKLKSLTKRWKEKAFARGADREQMATCEALDLTREEFLSIALEAMQARASELGF